MNLRTRNLVLIATAAAALTLGACGKGSSGNETVPGVIGPKVTFVENKFLLSLVIKDLKLDAGVRIPVPKMPNSFLEVGPDLQTSGYLINFGMDLSDLQTLLKEEVQSIAPTTLPGGRPLPGVAAGQLPAIAIQVPKLNNVVFYAGPGVFGVFVPVPFPKEMNGFMLTSRFYDSEGVQVGNLSIVGGDTNNKNGGVLVLLPIVGKVESALNAATPL